MNPMSEDADTRMLLRLMAWLSPSFPVGGFAYSGGLETAVHEGHVSSHRQLEEWLIVLLRNGSLWNDAVLLAEAYRSVGDSSRLAASAELAEALAGSAERHLEIVRQGGAFLAAAGSWPCPVLSLLDDTTPYSVAVGAVAASSGIPLAATLAAFLHSLASQLISAAIRLGVTGQRQGVALLSRLEDVLAEQAENAARSSLDDLGGAALIADQMSLRHEIQLSRLFLS